MDARKIEELAVDAVRMTVDQCERLSASFNTQDKEIAIDGYISVFSTEKQTKSNCKGKIPVQIKGKAASSKSINHCKYSVTTSDLRFFYEVEGGIIFFVVCGLETFRAKKIFYSILLPYDLKLLLNELDKSGKQSKTLKLRQLPVDLRDIERICSNFLNDKSNQATIKLVGLHDINSLREKGVDATSLCFNRIVYENELLTSLSVYEGGTYIYAKTKAGETYPIEKWERPALIQAGIERSVSSGETSKRAMVFMGEADDGTHHISFPGFEITLSDEKAGLTFTDSGTVRQRFERCELACSVYKNQTLCIDGVPLFQGITLDSGSIEDIESRLGSYRVLVALMDKMGIKTDWDMDNLDQNDKWKLNILIKGILLEEAIKLNQHLQALTNIEIDGGRIRLYAEELEESKYRIHDVLDPDFQHMGIPITTDNGEEKTIPIPSLLTFSVEDYKYGINLDADRFTSSLDSNPLDHALDGYATDKLLEMLRAWDDQPLCPEDLLSCAEVLSSKLLSMDPLDPVKVINHLQVKARKAKLGDEDRRILTKMVCNPSNASRNEVMASAYVLLENSILAEEYLSKLDADSAELFYSWPISNLIKHPYSAK